MSVVVYTDGSCHRNPDGPGGWAALAVFDDGETRLQRGREPVTTNKFEACRGKDPLQLAALLEEARSDAAAIAETPSC